MRSDFVELPSQLYEHWLERPEILERFALHYRTGEPMPQDLLGGLSPREISTRVLPPWNCGLRPIRSGIHALRGARQRSMSAPFEKAILAADRHAAPRS